MSEVMIVLLPTPSGDMLSQAIRAQIYQDRPSPTRRIRTSLRMTEGAFSKNGGEV